MWLANISPNRVAPHVVKRPRLDHVAWGHLHRDDPQGILRLRQAAPEYLRNGPYQTVTEGDNTTTVDVIGEEAAANDTTSRQPDRGGRLPMLPDGRPS